MATENGSETREDQEQNSEVSKNLGNMALEDLQTRVDTLEAENSELKDKLSLGDHETFSDEIGELNTEIRNMRKELEESKTLAEQGKIALDIARRDAESAYIDYQGTRIKDESDPKLAEVRSEIDRCMSIIQLHETRDTYRRLSREQRMGGRKSSDRETTAASVGNRHSNTPPSNYGLNISGVG